MPEIAPIEGLIPIDGLSFPARSDLLIMC